MPRHIAFLRAINVGGRRVKMDRLREIVQQLGFAGVETFIASGNVAFEAPAGDGATLETRIEHHLQQQLGYTVDTFVRSAAELREIAEHDPFPGSAPIGAEGDAGALMVAFLKAPPTEEAWQRLLRHQSETDNFRAYGREVYWLCRTRISESAFSGALLERALGVPATMRNVTTVRALAAKYPS
jgi:uncharacterized protein (DUF1697 family)